jgi:hypothetical protein
MPRNSSAKSSAARFARRVSLQPRLDPLPSSLGEMKAILRASGEDARAEQPPSKALPPTPLQPLAKRTLGSDADTAKAASEKFGAGGRRPSAAMVQPPLVVTALGSSRRESLASRQSGRQSGHCKGASSLRRRFSTIPAASSQCGVDGDLAAAAARQAASMERLLADTDAVKGRRSQRLAVSSSTAAQILRRRGVRHKRSEVSATVASRVLLQVQWLDFISFLRGGRALQQRAAAIRAARQEQHGGARTIQTAYRARQDAEMARTNANFLRVTARFAWKLKLQVRAARRRMAAAWARQFFAQHGRLSFRTIVGNFRALVLRAQRVWRECLACRRARLRNLDRVWDRFEEVVRAAQRREAKRKATSAAQVAQRGGGSEPTNNTAAAMSRHLVRQREAYQELQANVLGLLESTGGATDHFAACSIGQELRLPMLRAKLAAWRKEHIVRHSAAHRDARLEWENASEQQEMLQVVSESGPQGLTAKLSAVELGAPRPRWPMLITTARACADTELATAVRDMMLRALRDHTLTAGTPGARRRSLAAPGGGVLSED